MLCKNVLKIEINIVNETITLSKNNDMKIIM